ncbi:ATP-binding cassette sub-family C member 5-like isoform X4 [Microplitis mediator]|uniref:ATP-binding cassette sub-family C member 5-like isoform X4 n=1 Tax=Microplitis mediator TaxID=375433 RepID=UPI002554736A|nr:ATP-binding cassette sub-family C member 5-like isoform X4 [Microplitis mediator]
MIIDEIGVKDESFTPSKRSTVDIDSFGYERGTEMFKHEYRKSRKLSRYNSALKNLIPIRLGKTSDGEMPIDKAGFFSTISFSWITRYLLISNRQGITLDDLPKPSPHDTADLNAKRLEALWNDEVMRNSLTGASFSRAAWKFIRTRIFMASLMFGSSAILGFLGPAIVMRKLLEHIESPEGSVYTGIMWIFLLMISDLLRVTFFSWGWSACYRTGLRMKSAFISVMYRKLIKTSNLSNQNSGKLINMMSNDSQAVYDLCIYTPMIIAGPIITILIIIYILFVLSPLALSGFLFFFCFYPLQYLISRLNGYFRKRSIIMSDQRVSAANEIFNCIKLIKMYAWEDPFSLNLLELRNKEKSWLAKMCITRSYGSSLTVTIPIIAAIISFLVHVAGGYSLSAAQVFPFVLLLNSQTRHMISFFEVAITTVVNTRVSFARIKSVMSMEENNSFIQKPIVKSQALSIMNGTFVCDVDSCNLKSAEKKKKRKLNKDDLEKNELEFLMPKRIEILSDINFEAAKSKLIGICGHVGSGKSSLLRAALGQIRITNGKISRDGSCAYVSQQAWIQNATFRDNILFGHKFDSHRYYTAIDVCCLQEDIDSLPAADETEIGERGVNLSGGQKQRVALARAYYANQDIYFLDDPLSAVDINVGWYIFENLIQRALKDKCVILVTHQIPYLSRCDQIYMMSNGRIVEQGDHVSLMQAGKEYASMVKSDKSIMTNSIFNNNKEIHDKLSKMYDNSNTLTLKQDSQNEGRDQQKEEDEETIDGTLIEPEYMETGSIKKHTYLLYIGAMGGSLIAVIVLINVLLNTSCILFSSWWLATWIKAGSGGQTITVGNETVVSNNIIDNPDIGYYQAVYAACILAILGSSLLRGFVLTRVALIASTTLHNKLFKKIMSTTMQFFETTPKGRLQNIFSRDIGELDGQLPINIENSLNSIFHGVLNVLMVCVILPYLTIPFILLSILFYFVSKLFRKTLRDLQRHENTSKSPIFSFATATLQGLDTIHAFKKESQFIDKFYEYIDLNGTCEFLSSVLLRWAAIRFDILTIIAYVCTGFTVVLLKGNISPAMAGLALSFCGQMTGFLQYTIRLLSITELKFISVERMGFYLRTLKSEDEYTKISTSLKPYDWPQNGAVEFRNVALRYRKNTPIILNNISFNAVAGEKLGIVGRTGSGKSSLITALFRLVELSDGCIKIDGSDVTTISLNKLRSKLSIIPQDPIIFNGSIRYNLDPWKVKTDEEIWSALEKTKLKNKVITMPGQLNAFVDSGGSNMSMGERQLLCLARVLLRKNKIIILDEATASVDPITESIVQTTIQEEFSDCTIMIIAHRLQNVLSCDRILVMENGKILEFDTPSKLLDNPDSEFSKMIAAADKKNNNY